MRYSHYENVLVGKKSINKIFESFDCSSNDKKMINTL
jgi:hypothetical protein